MPAAGQGDTGGLPPGIISDLDTKAVLEAVVPRDASNGGMSVGEKKNLGR